MGEGKRITPGDLELESGSGSGQGLTLKEARERLESELVRQALRKHGGRITSAAIELGISRPTLYDLMHRLAIK